MNNNNTEQFQWTDELAKELCEYVGMRVGKNKDIHQQVELLTEDFKKLKASSNTGKEEQHKPDWEILEIYRPKDNSLHCTSKQDIRILFLEDKNTEFAIFKVKRISDNSIWYDGQDIEQGKINKIYLLGNGNRMMFEIKTEAYPYDYPLFIHELKSKPEEPLPIKVLDVSKGTSLNNPDLPVGYYHKFCTSVDIPQEKYEPIKKAIESVLNEGECLFNVDAINKRIEELRKEELMKACHDAFYAGRECLFSNKYDYKNKYPTFTDYYETIKK